MFRGLAFPMDATLQQRRLLTTLTFTLRADGVNVVERSPTIKRTFWVPYAHIPSKFTYLATGSPLWLWAGLILALLSIGTGIAALFHADVERFAWLVWGLLALGAGAVFLIKHRKF